MSLFYKRITALRERLSVVEPDTAWIIVPENRRYLSGYSAKDSMLTESSGCLLINKDNCLLVTDSRYTVQAKNEAADFDIRTINQNMVEGLGKIITLMGTKNLGFEEKYLTWKLYHEISDVLSKSFEPVRLSPLNCIVEDMREIKDEQEIHAIEVSAAMISKVMDAVIEDLEPGMSEKDISWKIQGMIHDSGADGLAFPPIVASGPNSALPHAVPTDRRIKTHEPVVIDIGLEHKGYCSDITRTVFLQGATPELKKIYNTVRQAQLRAIEGIKPGMSTDTADALARDLIEDAGYGEFFKHGLGHGVGLAVHERPRIALTQPVTIKEGMVFTVEPGIYIPDLGGVRLEEMVLVNADGVRILTRAGHFYDF